MQRASLPNFWGNKLRDIYPKSTTIYEICSSMRVELIYFLYCILKFAKCEAEVELTGF